MSQDLIVTRALLCSLSLLALAACSSDTPDPASAALEHAETYSITDLIVGEASYKTNCVSCHGRTLEGAAGVNLVDSEWIHGETIADISHSIAMGFPDAGMPKFSELLSETEIDHLAKFIRSKRQGLDHVDYRIYPVEEGAAPDFSVVDTTDPVVSGRFKNGLADFERIEIPHFIVVLEGPLSVPWEEPTALLFEEAGWTGANPNTELRVEIDGQTVTPIDPGGWDWVFPLERGSHTLKMAYFVSGPIAPGESWTMWHKSSARAYIARRDGSAKLSPLSRRAKIDMENTVVEVDVDTVPQVVRIPTLDLPSYSVNVGLTNGMSYAFNTRSCDIVGLWTGDFLNIGPNIIGRGKEASKPLGAWAFHHPDVLSIDGTTEADCEYEKYSRGETPAFYFKKNGADYRLAGRPVDNGIRFDLSIVDGASDSDVSFKAPDLDGFRVTTAETTEAPQTGYRPHQSIIIEKL